MNLEKFWGELGVIFRASRLAPQLSGPHGNVSAFLRALSQFHRICSYVCAAFQERCVFSLLSTTVPATGSQPFLLQGKVMIAQRMCHPLVLSAALAAIGHEKVGWGTSLA